MKTKGKGVSLSQLWKRNAVVAAIALFVCAAVYLNWNYEQETAAGKTLGESTMVDGQTEDPLVGASGTAGQEDPTAGTGEAGQTSSSNSYFATARLNRQQARDSALTLLQEAAAGEDADQTMKDQANDTIQAMADYTVTEAQIENLVVAKGYTDCVAFIGDESVSLAVAAPEGGITEADTARIVDIVTEVAGFTRSRSLRWSRDARENRIRKKRGALLPSSFLSDFCWVRCLYRSRYVLIEAERHDKIRKICFSSRVLQHNRKNKKFNL